MLELLSVAGSAPAATEPRPKVGFFARILGGPVAAARRRGEADFARLGLRTERAAEQRTRAASRVPEMVGPTIVRGERHGRAVEIRIDSNRHRTKVAAAVPELHVRSENGQLRASERSPKAVHDALAGLSPDRRWEGVEAKGGADGITVFHRIGSRGGETQGYLDDLWLAESLADLLGQP